MTKLLMPLCFEACEDERVDAVPVLQMSLRQLVGSQRCAEILPPSRQNDVQTSYPHHGTPAWTETPYVLFLRYH